MYIHPTTETAHPWVQALQQQRGGGGVGTAGYDSGQYCGEGEIRRHRGTFGGTPEGTSAHSEENLHIEDTSQNTFWGAPAQDERPKYYKCRLDRHMHAVAYNNVQHPCG